MLKPRKKLTRKEIKEDKLVTYYVQAQKLIQKYAQQINVGLIAVIVIVAGSIFLSHGQKGTEKRAATELAKVEPYFYAQQYDRAIIELTQVVDTFSGTKAGAKAAFLLATAYYQNEDYENALKYFEMNEKKNSNNILVQASSLAGMAACYESLDKNEEAAKYYEKAGKKFGHHFTAPENLFQAARCYAKVGQKDKVMELYTLISEDYSDSAEAKDVEFLKAAL